MTRLYHTVPRLQAPVLDWIPARYHDAILAGTSTQDVSGYIQDAVDEVGSYELVFEPGTYGFAAEVVIPTAGGLRMAGRDATIKALGNIDTAGGRGALVSYIGSSVVSFDGITFNCNSMNANGLFICSGVRDRIENCNFTGLLAGYAGVRGANMLNGKIIGCSSAGFGRSLDFQKGWEFDIHMTGAPTLTFALVGGTADTITRSAGSWITDGFNVGDQIRVEMSASNNLQYEIASRTATVITLTAGSNNLVNEGPVAGCQVHVVSGTYYGFHVGLIQGCNFSARQGLRLHGYTKLVQTDHEHPVTQPALRNETNVASALPRCAAIVVGEEIDFASDQHMYVFDQVYTELDEGTVGMLKGIWSANNNNVGYFSGVQLHGASAAIADSIAIKALFGSGTCGDGWLKRWETAFDGEYQGSVDHALYDMSRMKVDSDVTNLFLAGTGLQPGEQTRSGTGKTDLMYHLDRGLFVGPQQISGIHAITPDTGASQINFAQASHFLLSGGGTLGASHVKNLYPGQRVLFQFNAGSTWTLDTSAFNLRGGINRLFLPGESVYLDVHSDSTIHEVGPKDLTLDNQNLAFSAALATLTAETKTVALTGAVVGDNVVVNPRQALPDGVSYAARVSASATVEIKVWNGSGGNVDLSSITWDIARRS